MEPLHAGPDLLGAPYRSQVNDKADVAVALSVEVPALGASSDIRHGYGFSRWGWTLLILWLAGCASSRSAPTALPELEPSAARTAVTVSPWDSRATPPGPAPHDGVTPASAPSATGWIDHDDTINGLQFSLPVGWQIVTIRDAEQAVALLRRADQLGGELVGVAIPRFVAQEGSAQALKVVAAGRQERAGNGPGPTMTVLVWPAGTVMLRFYLRATTALLRQSDGIEVMDARMDDTWRPQHRDAALLQYRFSAPDGDREALQVALLDESGGRLMVMTFTAPPGGYRDHEPLFRHIVYSVSFPGNAP